MVMTQCRCGSVTNFVRSGSTTVQLSCCERMMCVRMKVHYGPFSLTLSLCLCFSPLSIPTPPTPLCLMRTCVGVHALLVIILY